MIITDEVDCEALIAKAVESLRRWAGTYQGHGKGEEAALLRKAADLIENAERDAETAVHLTAFAAMADQKDQPGFSALLRHSSNLVMPARA